MQTGTVAGRPFDAALSQFGVMFFDEPAVAFSNIRAHLRPGGRIAFACWQSIDKNAWFFAPAIAELLPPPPALPPGKSPTGPFTLADADVTAALLGSAGFGEIDVSPVELAVEAPPDSVVDDVQFELMGLPPDRVPAARAAVAAHMRQFALGPTRSRFPLAFQLVTAMSPSA
jgi:SAM-dependent methyltransferase